MTKKITKAENKKFLAQARKLIVTYGGTATQTNTSYEAYIIQSEKYGSFNMLLDTDNTYCFSVFTRFETITKTIVDTFHCNPYSGKCNLHISDLNYMLLELDSFLEKLTAKE